MSEQNSIDGIMVESFPMASDVERKKTARDLEHIRMDTRTHHLSINRYEFDVPSLGTSCKFDFTQQSIRV